MNGKRKRKKKKKREKVAEWSTREIKHFTGGPHNALPTHVVRNPYSFLLLRTRIFSFCRWYKKVVLSSLKLQALISPRLLLLLLLSLHSQIMTTGNMGLKNTEEAAHLNGGDGFNPGAAPPFRINDIRAAIPKHCWVKDPWMSMSFVAKDAVVVALFAAVAAYFDSWVLWPLYWVAQGTMFWAMFVLGHDCGHGSFSDCPALNSVVGHVLHSFILVPYHGWRISHRTHHQNHGHVENDESWVPMPESLYKNLDSMTRLLRYTIPFPIFAYPLYLWRRSPGKHGSHFNPYSDLFAPNERFDVITSTTCWAIMVVLLAYSATVIGPSNLFKLYGVPYLIFVMWLDTVTYLHHHGHDEKLPWYRGKEWSYLRGGLTTIDRDYGMFNSIHHDIGTHVVHHLFPQIPHYHLREATRAAKAVLGKYYREPSKSGPIPLHLFKVLASSMARDHFVKDDGEVVFYLTDPDIFSASKKTT